MRLHVRMLVYPYEGVGWGFGGLGRMGGGSLFGKSHPCLPSKIPADRRCNFLTFRSFAFPTHNSQIVAFLICIFKIRRDIYSLWNIDHPPWKNLATFPFSKFRIRASEQLHMIGSASLQSDSSVWRSLEVRCGRSAQVCKSDRYIQGSNRDKLYALAPGSLPIICTIIGEEWWGSRRWLCTNGPAMLFLFG